MPHMFQGLGHEEIWASGSVFISLCAHLRWREAGGVVSGSLLSVMRTFESTCVHVSVDTCLYLRVYTCVYQPKCVSFLYQHACMCKHVYVHTHMCPCRCVQLGAHICA